MRLHWISNTRFYTVVVEADLFGQVVLTRSWGSRFSRRGNGMQQCLNADEVEQHLRRLAATRAKRGYTPA